MTHKLMNLGTGLGVVVPALDARRCGFLAGSHVNVTMQPGEIRITTLRRPTRPEDIESYENFCEAELKKAMPDHCWSRDKP